MLSFIIPLLLNVEVALLVACFVHFPFVYFYSLFRIV